MKTKKVYFLGGLFLLGVSLFSCRKPAATYAIPSTRPADFSQVFEQFWNGMNENYLYWDIDTTHWNVIYSQYKPVFASLSLQDSADIIKSVHYFRAMTHGLVDAHFQIVFNHPVLQGAILFPAADRYQAGGDFHFPFDYAAVDTAYFDKDYTVAHAQVPGPDSGTLRVVLATIKNKIIYFSCNRFALSALYTSSQTNAVQPVLGSLFHHINADAPGTAGIIIDVRNNAGGDLGDLSFLAGRFIDKPLQFGYSRFKADRGPLDYTPWLNAFITPQVGGIAIGYPIIILTDHYTVSLSEAVAMALHLLPNCKTIGETTWGATGPLAANEVYNDGQFSIPGFLTVYTSSAEFKYIDNKMYEGKGFSPDIAIPFNATDLQAGNDPALEKAIQSIP